eukprot:m.259357 g.259357  ORF g.259357 m.259357 type:complete len:423 (+) comp37936_c0_seq1:238-1506(+)
MVLFEFVVLLLLSAWEVFPASSMHISLPPPAPPNSIPLKLLDPQTDALCLDGSVGGYHSRQSSKTSLMISLPGGGWCWDDHSCATRAMTSLGSTTQYIKDNGNEMVVGEGEMSADPTLNPHFYNWSLIVPVYCDGSNYAGVEDHHNVVSPTYNGTLYVRGRLILKSVIDVALHQWGLDETLEQVVLTGCSAGGTGTYFNVDFVNTYIQSQLKHSKPFKTRAFGNAGWFMDTNSATWDGDAWNGIPGIQRYADQALYSYAALSTTLNAQCIKAYAPINESWKCAMSQYLYPFIETPTLVLQSSYDLNQLVTGGPQCVHGDWISGGEPVRPFPNTFSNCTATEVEEINSYGDALNASLFIARHVGVFAPTCTIHCYTGHWTQIKIDTVTMADAIGAFQATDNPSGMVWYDTCRGGNCNPTCPIA